MSSRTIWKRYSGHSIGIWVGDVVVATCGDFRVRIDPCEVDHGDQTPLASLEDRPDEHVNHEI